MTQAKIQIVKNDSTHKKAKAKRISKKNVKTAECVGKPIDSEHTLKPSPHPAHHAKKSAEYAETSPHADKLIPPHKKEALTSVYNLPLQIVDAMLNPWRAFFLGATWLGD